MGLQLRSPLLIPLLILSQLLCASIFTLGSPITREEEVEEEFHEGLLLRPLPDRKVLAHFHFKSSAPPSLSNTRHHHLFPKSIYQLARKFDVKELELSFTQGRWNYERWGGFDPVSSNNAKPPGVELWAVFDVPQEEIDVSWKNLTHALAGLFCASINFLDSSTMFSAPKWTFGEGSGRLRYGVLPREAVCTENLTPWLKLLPCRDKAGISTLMDRPSIYRGFYHSQRLHLRSFKSGLDSIGSGIVLEQTLTIVLQPASQRTTTSHSGEKSFQPSWSLSSIFGRKVSGRCVLAKSSYVYVQLEKTLVAQLMKNKNQEADNVASEGFWREPSFELSVKPDTVIREANGLVGQGTSVFYEYLMEKYNDSQPFDLGFTWNVPLTWSCQQAPLHTSRFLMGSGNERGAIAVLFKSKELPDSSLQANIPNNECKLQVHVFQVVPWYIKVYYHTLHLFINDQPKAVEDFVEKILVLPSKDKVSPGVMEMVLNLPCGVKSASLTLEFDKGFLHIDEYPPDANQGFDIPSAIVRFPDFSTSLVFPSVDYLDKSPIISKLQEKSPILSYMEVLLVPLTTPDFSMPYNVITITCTVFALYFGSLLNVLRRRVGEEERLLKSKAATKSLWLPQLPSKLSAKLRGRPWQLPQSPSELSSFINSKVVLKVLLVALVALLAVAWQYYIG